ncbi:MAG: class I SAM-dependent methyltransferase [Omnitrophica WOR_2 bacterium]
MMAETEIKQQVREFYDQVGWQEAGEGFYQNAHYEDLRPVSREYIHNCHLRVLQHLKPCGHFLLDAGSGPIQYPEYLEYSRGYSRRVCADISMVALEEARKRIGYHGLFVAADIANLPFKDESFDGVVSLHTIHHLPLQEHGQAYQELYRLLAPGSTAVVVNGWDTSPLMDLLDAPIHWVERLYAWKQQLQGKAVPNHGSNKKGKKGQGSQAGVPKGTYVRKHNSGWLKHEVGALVPLQIWVWRSVTVRFLRTFIHERRGGRALLRLLFRLEERFPHFFGEKGNYPLIVIRKA